MRKLNDWIDSFMEFVEDSEPPRQFCLWAAIATIATVLERKVHMVWENVTFANCYIVLVGPSGVQKSFAMSKAREIISRIDHISFALDVTSSRKLVDCLEKSARDTPTPNGRPIMHSSLTAWASEFTVFLKKDEREIMLPLLTHLYDCIDPLTYGTFHSGGHEVRNPCLNIYACTTPNILQESLGISAIGGGFTSRIIFVYGDKPYKIVPFPWVNVNEQLERDLTNDLLHISYLTGRFGFDEDFLKTYGDWYCDQRMNPPSILSPDRFGGYLNRRAKHLLKLCMIVNVSRTSDMIIRSQDINRALKILVETESRMPEAFGGVGASQIAAEIFQVKRFLEEHKQATMGQLMQRFQNDIDLDTLKKVIASLYMMKHVDTEHPTSGNISDQVIKFRINRYGG